MIFTTRSLITLLEMIEHKQQRKQWKAASKLEYNIDIFHCVDPRNSFF